MISLDITLFIQMINFIVTLVLINFLLVSPIRRIIQKRKQLIQSQEAEADSLFNDAGKLLADYEARLKNARQAAVARRNEQQEKAHEEEQSLLSGAMKQAEAYLRDARTELKNEADNAREKLKADVDGLAAMAVAKVLN